MAQSNDTKIKKAPGRPRRIKLVELINKEASTEETPIVETGQETVTRFETEINRTVHKDRVPIHRNRDILSTYNIPDGFTGRWVKDFPGRVEKYLAAGWTMLTQRGIKIGEGGLGSKKEVGDVITRHAGPRDGYTLYLMVIPTELYNKDQMEKQILVDEVDRAMERKVHGENNYGTIDRSVSFT